MKYISIMTILFFVTASISSLPAAAQQADAFKEEELDQMLAPIALYPDPLLAQVLMAATYPADVTEAAQWSQANPDQQGDAATPAIDDHQLHRTGPRHAVLEGGRRRQRLGIVGAQQLR